MSTPGSFEGKWCLVTGGSKGIGKAIVEALLAMKASVFTCSRHAEELQPLIDEWRSNGHDVHGCVCDVTKKDDLTALVAKVSSSSEGKLYTLVNNAGTATRYKKATEYTDEEYDRIMTTNIWSAYELARMCHPLLKAAKGASVVFLGSISAGPRTPGTGLIYSVTKASCNQMAKTLGCEWAQDKIRVNCVGSGLVRTDMTADIWNNEELTTRTLKEIPMKRAGKAEEIANAVVFFCGDESSYVTGQTLYVDGGFSIQGIIV